VGGVIKEKRGVKLKKKICRDDICHRRNGDDEEIDSLLYEVKRGKSMRLAELKGNIFLKRYSRKKKREIDGKLKKKRGDMGPGLAKADDRFIRDRVR